MTTIDFNKLHNDSHQWTVMKMEEYGNVLSDLHKRVLQQLNGKMCYMATSNQSKERIAFPLSCGGGKTLSIISLVRTLSENGWLEDAPIAVSAFRVEALCQLKRDMVAAGVPEDKIGLIHSYTYKEGINRTDIEVGFASEPATVDNSKRPVLMVSHNKLRNKDEDGLAMFTHYQGEPRALLIWDESLIGSESQCLDTLKIEMAMASYRVLVNNHYRNRPEHKNISEAFDYIQTALDKAKAKADRIKDAKTEKYELLLPDLTHTQIREYKESISLTNRTRGAGDMAKPLLEFLEVCQNPMRVDFVDLDMSGATHVILTYRTVVDRSLDNILVLDASARIRELEMMDTSIDCWKVPEVSDYNQLLIRTIRHRAGREAVENAFSEPESLLVKECVDYIEGIPEDEAILIFTFKQRGNLSCKDILKGAMSDAGLDPKAKLDNGKDKYCWLTLGNETSLNSFSYCTRQLWCGALYKDRGVNKAAIIGQSDDINRPVNRGCLNDIEASELAYSYHQGFARGACRIIKDGIAGAQEVVIMFSHPYLKPMDRVAEVMPGIRREVYQTKYLKTELKVEVLSGMVSKFLKGYEGDRISVKALKKALELENYNAHRNTVKTAIDDALDTTCQDWCREGLSLVNWTALDN